MQTDRRAPQRLAEAAALALASVVASCSSPEEPPAMIKSGSGGQAATDGCLAGEQLCGDTCVSTATDPEHCGSCTIRCIDGVCADGQCSGASEATEGGSSAGSTGGTGGTSSGGVSASTGGRSQTGSGGTAPETPGSDGGTPSTGGRSSTGGSVVSGESTCVRGVDTGDACDPAVDVEPCERSTRTCVCGASREWTCTPLEGEETSSGGSTGVGGGGGTGGRSTGGASQTGGTSSAGGSGSTGGSSTTTPSTLAKFVGNITTSDAVDTDGKKFATYWDQISPENAGKWGSVQWGGGSYNWATLDAIYQYAQDNNIVFKQHTFVWGNQQPSFSIGEAQVKDWMSSFCSRYPETKIIDVVNEPPPHTTPAYANSIGGGTNGSWQWIINAFVWAREACPGAILLLNDYNNTEWPNDNNNTINIVKTLLAADAPIDAIGAQAHDYDLVNFSTIKPLLEKLHKDTGLPVYITEYDPSTADDNQQLNWYKEHFPYFLETEWIHGVTIWGWIYGKTWSSAPQSGLIRNGSPRPAMTWLMEQLGRPAP